MADISTYLTRIKKAVKGEDVRTSIHDAIKKINNEVTACNNEHAAIHQEITVLDTKVDRAVQEIAAGLTSEIEERIGEINRKTDELDEKIDDTEEKLTDKTNDLDAKIDGTEEELNAAIYNTKTELSDLIMSVTDALKEDTDVRYSLTTDKLIGYPNSVCPFKILISGNPNSYGPPTKGALLKRGKWIKESQTGRLIFSQMYASGQDTFGNANVIGNFAFAYSTIDVLLSPSDGYSLNVRVFPKGQGTTEEEIVTNGYPQSWAPQYDDTTPIDPDSTGYYKIEKYVWFVMTLTKETGDFPIPADTSIIPFIDDATFEELTNALAVVGEGQNVISNVTVNYHERLLKNLADLVIEQVENSPGVGDLPKVIKNPKQFKMSDQGRFLNHTHGIYDGNGWVEYNISNGKINNTTETYCYDIPIVLFLNYVGKGATVVTGAYHNLLMKVDPDETFDGGEAFYIPSDRYFQFGIKKNDEDDISETRRIKVFTYSEWIDFKREVSIGRGIVSIEKTSTVENVDTYTITFTDGTTFDFEIVNAMSPEDMADSIILINSAARFRRWVERFNGNVPGLCLIMSTFSFNFSVEREIGGETVSTTYTGVATRGDVWQISPSNYSIQKAFIMMTPGDYYTKGEIDAIIADLTYEPITLSSFSVVPSKAEKDAVITQLIFSWTVSKTPASAKITYGQNEITLDPSARSFTFTGSVSANTTFRLTVIDEKNAVATRDASISFMDRVYWGVGATFPGVAGCSSDLTSTKSRYLNLNAGSGQYIWYAYPAAWGTATFKVGGFEGGFSLNSTEDLTNSSGYTASYYIYKSDNAGLGATSVNVS